MLVSLRQSVVFVGNIDSNAKGVTVKDVRCARRDHCTYKNSAIQTRKRKGHSSGTAAAVVALLRA